MTDDFSPADCVTLSDLSPKDKVWRRHKTAAAELSNMFLNTRRRIRHGQRMSECASQLTFTDGHDPATGEYRLTLRGANFCRVRTCPVCQWRRSLLWRVRFYKLLPDVFLKYQSARYIFLTLTVANCHVASLRDTMKNMTAAWGRLQKRVEWKNVVLGWVRTIEITRELCRTDYAHPHYHAILMVKSSYFSRDYIKQDEWSALWQSCLRVDYMPRVDVRMVKSRSGKSDKIGGVERGGIIETLKYAVKSSDLLADVAWTEEMSCQIDGLRAIATGGCLKTMLAKLDEPGVEAAEMITLGESESALAENFVRFLWRDCDYRRV